MFFTHHAAQYALDPVTAPGLRGTLRQLEFDGSRRVKRRALARIDPKPNAQPAKNCSLASTRRTPESALMRSATALSRRPISSVTL